MSVVDVVIDHAFAIVITLRGDKILAKLLKDHTSRSLLGMLPHRLAFCCNEYGIGTLSAIDDKDFIANLASISIASQAYVTSQQILNIPSLHPSIDGLKPGSESLSPIIQMMGNYITRAYLAGDKCHEVLDEGGLVKHHCSP